MNNKKFKLGLAIFIVVLLIGGGVLAWWLLLGNKGGETISCSKNGEMLDQIATVTYQEKTPTKISFDYKFYKDKMPDDNNMNFSFTYSSNDGYSSNSDPEAAYVLFATMMALGFEQHKGEPGIEYSDDDQSKTRTVSLTADLTKNIDSGLKETLLEGTSDPEDFQKEYTSNGFVCKKK